jgi:hypothetical protein
MPVIFPAEFLPTTTALAERKVDNDIPKNRQPLSDISQKTKQSPIIIGFNLIDYPG